MVIKTDDKQEVSALVRRLIEIEERTYAGCSAPFARKLGIERHKWAAIKAGTEIRTVAVLRQILAAVPEVLPEALDYVRHGK